METLQNNLKQVLKPISDMQVDPSVTCLANIGCLVSISDFNGS